MRSGADHRIRNRTRFTTLRMGLDGKVVASGFHLFDLRRSARGEGKAAFVIADLTALSAPLTGRGRTGVSGGCPGGQHLMDTQRCQNHGPVRLLVPLLEFNEGPKEPGEHAEPSEPPLTRPISPDEQRGFPPPEDWGK